jgi:chromosome segregation ATPase
MDLIKYLGPIEPEAQPEPQPQPQPQPADTIDELRSEVSHVQNLLGTEKLRVAELETLVASLRTINDAQEQAVERANKETEKLALQLAAVEEELKIAAAVCQKLQIELDAAQQVPADSPELRQLRLDLAEVTLDRDEYRHAHELLVQDADTVHERTRAMTVEAIIEWLEPIRATIEAADNVQQTMRADNLACDIIRNLPGILRYVVGMNDPEEIE